MFLILLVHAPWPPSRSWILCGWDIHKVAVVLLAATASRSGLCHIGMENVSGGKIHIDQSTFVYLSNFDSCECKVLQANKCIVMAV